jgi:hypothetical protein
MHTALPRSLRKPTASPGVTQCTAETFFGDCFLATTSTARAKSVARLYHVADVALSANSRGPAVSAARCRRRQQEFRALQMRELRTPSQSTRRDVGGARPRRSRAACGSTASTSRVTRMNSAFSDCSRYTGVLYLPTDINSSYVNKDSSSFYSPGNERIFTPRLRCSLPPSPRVNTCIPPAAQL